ncbi:hypothetical protein [Mycolicibacterium setense]
MSGIQLSAKDESVLVSALRLQREHDTDMRSQCEKSLASGHGGLASGAAFYEKRLSDFDALITKLPRWFAQAVA